MKIKKQSDYNRAKKVVDDIDNLYSLQQESRFEHLSKWKSENRYADSVLRNLSDESYISSGKKEFEQLALEKDCRERQLISSIEKIRPRANIKLRFALISSIAAAIAVISFLLLRNSSDLHKESMIADKYMDIDKPTLITSDNRIVELTREKTVVAQDIQIQQNSSNKTLNCVLNNRVIIPKKYIHQIVLPDGSEVVLNANTEFNYPSQFAGNCREVELNGEAYFKIQKDKKPFVVTVNGTKVRVYGTEFNVKVTDDKISTVLISGSVGVTPKGKEEIIIEPNRMIVVDGDSVRVQDVDVKYYISWIVGLLCYDREPLETIIKDIENWYNVNFVELSPAMKNIPISASINKNLDIKEVIGSIELIIGKNIINEGGGIYRIEP